MPNTIPLADPTPATPGLPLLHVPPAGVTVNGVVIPTQIPVLPVIADGNEKTVTARVTEQPVTA